MDEKYNRLLESLPLCQAIYVWIDGSGEGVRGKTKVLPEKPHTVKEVPVWSTNGAHCGFAREECESGDLILFPVAIFPSPFDPPNGLLVLCETLNKDMEPSSTNHSRKCCQVMKKVADSHPWFGTEQMFSFLEKDGSLLGWPKDPLSRPYPQGPYYCGVGPDRIRGRSAMDSAVKAMLYATIKVAGHNVGAAPNQYEIQIGPCEGIELGDHLWMARYILGRVAEEHSLCVTFHPKPHPGDWNCNGGQTNFSTLAMRSKDGMDAIYEGIEKLAKRHMEHMAVYDPKGGEYNKLRLTGTQQTAAFEKFSYDFKARDGASVRIPLICVKEGKGYFEDRRPCSNSDPYLVSARLVETICLDE